MIMKNRNLIIAFFFFFALAAARLFVRNALEHDPAYQKNWWVIAFAEPGNPSRHDFLIGNYSDHETFRYRVIENGKVGLENTVAVAPGTEKTVALPEALEAAVIEVTAGQEKKTLYRR